MSIKKLIRIFISLFLTLSIQSITYANNFNVNAKSAILLEPISGTIIFEQDSTKELPIASVTKVMTILLIYESIEQGKIKWNDVVTVSNHAASMGGSQIWLEPKEQQTVKDLTKSIIIASANDSSVAMAEFIAGSEDSFVTMMNNKAKELGMKNTNFKNACGLDTDGHYSSALDVALMSKQLIIKYPEVKEYTTLWQDTIVHKTARGNQEFGLTNTNKLIKSYTGATGLKTGSTSKALYCLSGTAMRDDMELVSVILGASNPNVRFDEVKKLLDYGFANYSVAKGQLAGTVVDKVKIFKGNLDEVNVEVDKQVAVLVKKGDDVNLEYKVDLVNGLNAPIQKGTKAGCVSYIYNNKEVANVDVVTSEDVTQASLIKTMNSLLKRWAKFK